MQSASPEARRRALGELQLDLSRRPTRSAVSRARREQLDRQAGGTSRCEAEAGWRERELADRVDALRQAARRLGAIRRGCSRSSSGCRCAEGAGSSAADRPHASVGPADARRTRRPAPEGRWPRIDGGDGAADCRHARQGRRSGSNGADAGGAKGDAQRLADQLDQAQRRARAAGAPRETDQDDGSRRRRSRPGARGGRAGTCRAGGTRQRSARLAGRRSGRRRTSHASRTNTRASCSGRAS